MADFFENVRKRLSKETLAGAEYLGQAVDADYGSSFLKPKPRFSIDAGVTTSPFQSNKQATDVAQQITDSIAGRLKDDLNQSKSQLAELTQENARLNAQSQQAVGTALSGLSDTADVQVAGQSEVEGVDGVEAEGRRRRRGSLGTQAGLSI